MSIMCRHQETALSFMKTMAELTSLLEDPASLQEHVAKIALADRNKSLDKTFIDIKVCCAERFTKQNIFK